ncbi:hypothetical protein K432DRAFT_429867 [Lepidopterella palustris CBS 459.81]|uniref:CorA-like transporter domain-containing protein n=1 Tax=Lepidopterella palustris CBS 459.81 TaxID=1314670 RepID=A0A8E2J9X4_9PEZI|nr:hypothetical protein K432DRAFT_429867 [Lepidopterella palustris CBS 459.81]
MSSYSAETRDLIRDWEHYPSNLATIFTQDNLDLCHRRLQYDSRRLFNPDATDIRFDTVLLDGQAGLGQDAAKSQPMTDFITNEDQLEDILNKHLRTRGDHYIFLHQSHSWAPFNASEATFRKIFTAVQVRPSFLDFIHAFGQPEAGYEADLSGGYDFWLERAHGDSSGSSFDFFYLLRYVVKTGRDSWPWSDRRMGVYQKYNAEIGDSTWIIMQPTAAVRKLPQLCSPMGRSSVFEAHVFLLRSTLQSWKAYLRYLETQVRKDSRQARLDASTELNLQAPDFKLAFSNVQSLQHRCELIQDAISVLRSDAEILSGLQLLRRKAVKRPESPGQIHASESETHGLESCVSQFFLVQKWAKDMLNRARQASDLMTTLLNSKHSQALTFNTASMNRLAEASKLDGQLMVALTKSTKKDSGTMKLIAVITMIYLPGTFVASIFSTGFVNASLSDSTPGIRHQSLLQAWSYASATAGLMVITLVASYLWERRMESNEERNNAILQNTGNSIGHTGTRLSTLTFGGLSQP